MKSQESDRAPLLEDVLALLELRTGSTGLTPGQIRSGLASKAGIKRDLGQIKEACHELWQRRLIVVEPPAPGRREHRLWHAKNRKPEVCRDEASAPGRPAPPGRSTREGGADEHFRVTVCGQLAAEWARAGNPETREVLRRLLTNLGVERVEKPAEVVAFKGRRHECESAVLPGAAVRVTEPGWMLRQGGGEYLLAKARVMVA